MLPSPDDNDDDANGSDCGYCYSNSRTDCGVIFVRITFFCEGKVRSSGLIVVFQNFDFPRQAKFHLKAWKRNNVIKMYCHEQVSSINLKRFHGLTPVKRKTAVHRRFIFLNTPHVSYTVKIKYFISIRPKKRNRYYKNIYINKYAFLGPYGLLIMQLFYFDWGLKWHNSWLNLKNYWDWLAHIYISHIKTKVTPGHRFLLTTLALEHDIFIEMLTYTKYTCFPCQVFRYRAT